jgi:hypothetical protein
MGFSDIGMNQQALEASHGDIQIALAFLVDGV